MRNLYALTFALALLTAPLWAQQPAPIALTADEAQQLAAARQAVEQARAARSQAWAVIQQADVTDCARVTAAVSVAQRVERDVVIFEGREREALLKVRASHGCAECELVDGKLVRPEAKGKP